MKLSLITQKSGQEHEQCKNFISPDILQTTGQAEYQFNVELEPNGFQHIQYLQPVLH